MADFGIVESIALAASVAGAATSAYGAYEQGQSAEKAGKYNAEVADVNQKIANQNATTAAQAGEQQAGMASQKTRAAVGAMKANEAAAGIDVNSGSAVDVRSSAAALGELDAITIRSNAARTAYGYENQGRNFESQSQLDTFTGENAATAGAVGAGGTLLGGPGTAGTNWANFQMKSSGMNAPGTATSYGQYAAVTG